MESEHQRLRYRKLLKRLGELQAIRELTDKLETALEALVDRERRKLLDRVPEQYLLWDNIIIAHILMSTRGIYNALDRSLSIQEAVLHLRRSIEQLIRLLEYYREAPKHASTKDSALELALRKLYEEKVHVDLKTLKKLGLTPQQALDLRRIYSMLSEILHRIPPPPYHSLLELKLFKNILERLTQTLEEIVGTSTEHKEEQPSPWEKLALEQKAIEEAIHLAKHRKEEVTKVIQEAIKQLPAERPEDLKILPELAPTEKHLREGQITKEDFTEAVNEATTRLWGIGALKLTLALHALEELKQITAEKLIKNKLVSSEDPAHTEKTAFYTIILLLRSTLRELETSTQ